MPAKYNIHFTKTHLSKLIERVIGGEEIIIAKAGKPVAKLSPVQPHVVKRAPGSAAGQVVIHPNFDDPLPEFDDL